MTELILERVKDLMFKPFHVLEVDVNSGRRRGNQNQIPTDPYERSELMSYMNEVGMPYGFRLDEAEQSAKDVLSIAPILHAYVGHVSAAPYMDAEMRIDLSAKICRCLYVSKRWVPIPLRLKNSKAVYHEFRSVIEPSIDQGALAVCGALDALLRPLEWKYCDSDRTKSAARDANLKLRRFVEKYEGNHESMWNDLMRA